MTGKLADLVSGIRKYSYMLLPLTIAPLIINYCTRPRIEKNVAEEEIVENLKVGNYMKTKELAEDFESKYELDTNQILLENVFNGEIDFELYTNYLRIHDKSKIEENLKYEYFHLPRYFNQNNTYPKRNSHNRTKIIKLKDEFDKEYLVMINLNGEIYSTDGEVIQRNRIDEKLLKKVHVSDDQRSAFALSKSGLVYRLEVDSETGTIGDTLIYDNKETIGANSSLMNVDFDNDGLYVEEALFFTDNDSSVGIDLEGNLLDMSSIRLTYLELKPRPIIDKYEFVGLKENFSTEDDIIQGPFILDQDHDGLLEALFATKKEFYWVEQNSRTDFRDKIFNLNLPISDFLKIDNIQIQDINGDSLDDILISYIVDPSINNYGVSVRFGNVETPFQDGWDTKVRTRFNANMAVCDVDNDGVNEIISVSSAQRVYIIDSSDGFIQKFLNLSRYDKTPIDTYCGTLNDEELLVFARSDTLQIFSQDLFDDQKIDD